MKTNKRQAFKIWCLWCISAFAVSGCGHVNKGAGTEVSQTSTAQVQPETQAYQTAVGSKEAKGNEVQTPDYYVHTVRWHGETLSYIAKWYTGQFKNWKVLAKANPTLNPNRIYKGNQIIIPEGVLKTRRPLPKNFIVKLTPQGTNNQSSVKASGQTEDEKTIPLFGPKEH